MSRPKGETIKRLITRKLTKEQSEKRGAELADTYLEFAKIRDRAREYNRKYQRARTDLEEKMEGLAKARATGTESIEMLVVAKREGKEIVYLDHKTGEELDRRPMDVSEMEQAKLEEKNTSAASATK